MTNSEEQFEEEIKVEKVSKKRIIFVDIDDEITSIQDKISQVKAKRIYLVIPKRSVVFQSVINLKILQKHSKDLKKKLHFITNDQNGINLANQVGIVVYDKVNNDEGPSFFSSELEDDILKITPLKASVNSIEEHTPTRLSTKKSSISELLNVGGKKKVTESNITNGVPNIPKFKVSTPNKGALVTLITFVFIILIVVFYIALPGATVYLVPSASVLEKSVNITLADFNKNKAELDTHPHHMIASYPISLDVEKTITHYTTGKKFSDKGANSKGKLTIINTTGADWPLIPKTRFQTEDGIVFRVTDYVNVPAKTDAGDGKLEVFVTADETDAYGEVVGERGNIGPSTFILPGLNESNQKLLHAESSEPMSGGVTDYINYVSADDIEAAKQKINDVLVSEAIEELKLRVADISENSGSDITYVLLEGEGAVKLGKAYSNVPNNIEDSSLESFDVSGSITVSGLYYDRSAMLEILKGELITKKSPQKELLRINEDSTSYRIFNWDDATGKVKLTANIKGIEQFDIDPDSENGKNLLNKIREHIAGQDIESAKQYIQNLTEINKVEIESWPAWAPTIPKLPENIDFEISEAMTVE